MGLEGDVAIESRLVSKTIENAQSRVEGYNFDIRKRVVEYDDVINKQRETIYSERDKVLNNEDLGYAIIGFVTGELDLLVEQHLGPATEGWDVDAFAHAISHLGIVGDGIDADSLAELHTQDEVIDAVTEAAEATLAERQARYGEQTWAMVERLVLLRSIDQLWVDHLTELDDFRRGVGLRGYGGTDPLVEFKREAFKLYDELRAFIRHQVASTIFRVNVQVQQPTPAAPPPARNLPMPTPQQMAMLRAAAAARAKANQLAASTQGDGTPASGDGAVPAASPSGATPSDMAVTDGAIVEMEALPEFAEDLDLDAGDLASYDEIAGDDATPGFADAATAEGAAVPLSAEGAAVPLSAEAIVPGLMPKPVRNMTLQRGDEAIANISGVASSASDPGSRLGRNDPCYCGSGLKYKKCHGK
ncbi:MAG: SEC-C domain-containing protein [Chloroflexi bacterium]|nr:SEC-C domain-containing protein [Chloroflexota bacterium]